MSSWDAIRHSRDDNQNLKSDVDATNIAREFQRGHEPDVAAGYFAVCREYVPGGINGKPPERTTPAGAVIAAESPSVYQSMYRSLFDRKQGPSLDTGKGNGKSTKRARNVFFVVLRLGHLMLYDDSEQLEVRHVISLEHHDVSIYSGGDDIPEGELWIKRNAICLTRKPNLVDYTRLSKPFYLFSENCSDKEDFYFALLLNQEVKPDAPDNPPRPLQYDTKHVIMLVQKLHSSEEQMQTRWINALMGRLFLALYKTPEIEDYIRGKITKKIARVKKPAFLSGIVLQKMNMGESAPYITNPRLKDLTVDGDCCVEADFKYNGNFRIEIAATARIDLGSRFKVREVNLVLAVVLKKMEGHALVKFKPPPSNRIWISFETMPDMEMVIEPIVSSRQITYNIILRAIESRIREVIAETLVLPHWDDSPFTRTLDQEFRGGIWADERSKSFPPTKHTRVPEEEAEEDIPADADPALAPPDSPPSRDERTMSMPVLSDPAISASMIRKAVKSTHALVESTDSAASTSVQKRSETPKVMRSQSFASAANPLVSMDNANKDSKAVEKKSNQQQDATSAMMAISHRSGPTTPIMTPVGSPPKTSTLWENSKAGSFSSSSSKADSVLEQTATQLNINNPNQASLPPTPTSTSSRSTISTKGGEMQNPTALQSITQTVGPSEKRQPIASIGAATAAAKKWGWGVLSRGSEQKHGPESASDPARAGTPEHPIGRGRPLPPPGQPLPFPDRARQKASLAAVPKRKNLPPPMLPQRRQDENKSRTVPAPPLPARRRKEGIPPNDADDEGLLVVEAPPDSEPTSPMNDSQEQFIGYLEFNPGKLDEMKSTEYEQRPEPEQKPPSLPQVKKDRQTSSSEDEENALASWNLAQEEEVRSKSIWMDNNEQS